MRRTKRHLQSEVTAWLEEIDRKLEARGKFPQNSSPIAADVIVRIAEQGSRLFLTEFLHVVASSPIRAKKMLLLLNRHSERIYALLIATQKGRADRGLLLRLIDILENIRQRCKDHDGTMVASMTLTSRDRSLLLPLLRQQANILREVLDSSHTDLKLRSILYGEVERIIRDRQLSGRRLKNLSVMIRQLSTASFLDDQKVVRILLEHNFNSPQFFSYWTGRCLALLTDEDSPYQQVETILRWESELLSLPRTSERDGLFHGESLQKMTLRLYRKLKALSLQKLDLRTSKRAAAAQENYRQININLSVAQLGLLIRIFMEHGILPKHDVGKTFAHYARIYRTERTAQISADSLQKKSTDVEYATVKKIKSHLIAMINWLNKNYGSTVD